MAQVSQQVMKHNFLTVILACCRGPDAPSQTQSAWFPATADADPEVCWCSSRGLRGNVRSGGKVQRVKKERRVSALFPSFLVNETLHDYARLASRSFSHQDVNSNSTFPSAVWFFLLPWRLRQILLQSGVIFPISNGHSVEFNFVECTKPLYSFKVDVSVCRLPINSFLFR